MRQRISIRGCVSQSRNQLFFSMNFTKDHCITSLSLKARGPSILYTTNITITHITTTTTASSSFAPSIHYLDALLFLLELVFSVNMFEKDWLNYKIIYKYIGYISEKETGTYFFL